MTLRRLKWLAIVAPVVFLTAAWTLLHTESLGLHHSETQEGVILLGVTIVGTAFFAYSMFAMINRLERRILEQNRELEQRNQELAALLEVGRASSSLELGDVLNKATAAILEVTRADEAEVWLRADSGELALARHGGLEPGALRELTRLGPGEGLPGLAAESGAPVVVSDLASDSRFLREAVKALGFRSFCALPLRHRGQTVGVLGVASHDPKRLCSQLELRLLEGVGEQLAVAIENARLHERVLDGAVLEEHKRIGRELHDGLGQLVGYVNAQTLAVKRLLASERRDEAERHAAELEKTAKRVSTDLREAILGLRTSGHGLLPSLRMYLADYGRIAETRVLLEADADVAALELRVSTEIQLVRIVQEALSNVRKHACARSAIVRLATEEDELTVEVADDGRGFDSDHLAGTGWPHFGLETMRERAEVIGGRFAIVSSPDGGTRVTIRVPLGRKGVLADARAAG